MSARSTPRVVTRSSAGPRRSGPRPIYVIGGFLGSGKTTLLKRLLAHQIGRGIRPTVIMNEYGERNVDSRILHDHLGGSEDLEMRELLNGCVCCDLSGDLSKTLADLSRAGSGPIFIETTGLAEVSQVVAAVSAASDRSSDDVPTSARKPTVVTVLDAGRFRVPAARRSSTADVRAADVVVINKIDQVKQRARLGLEGRIRGLNPQARVLAAAFAEIDPLAILDAPLVRDGGERRGREEPSDSRRGFTSVTCEIRGPVDVRRLKALLVRYRGRIARLKGFIRIANRRGIHEVQWVPGTLDVRVNKRAGAQTPHLIIIGRNVNWGRFFDATADCVVGGPRETGSRDRSGRGRRQGGQQSSDVPEAEQ